MRRALNRFMSENLFKDSEGRFKTRWNENDNPTVKIENVKDIPNYTARIDFPLDKKRIFDFDLPTDLRSLEPPLQIWAMADGMFSVNNVWLPGPILIFPEAVFQWHAPRLDDLEDHHLEILKMIRPRLEYAIIGTGRGKVLNYAEGVRKRFRSIGINLDLCPTVSDN